MQNTPPAHQLVLCTCPDQETAEELARILLNKKCAACINILPGVISLYTWENKIEKTQEHLLLIKSTRAQFSTIQEMIVQHHPYELPEIIAVPITDGLPDYLHWIDTCVC